MRSRKASENSSCVLAPSPLSRAGARGTEVPQGPSKHDECRQYILYFSKVPSFATETN
jgi:hypothetical protein